MDQTGADSGGVGRTNGHGETNGEQTNGHGETNGGQTNRRRLATDGGSWSFVDLPEIDGTGKRWWDVPSPSDRPAEFDGATQSSGSMTTAHSDGPGVDWRVTDGPTVGEDVLRDHEFALCLTHDVDRPFKRVQALYYAARDRDPRQLRALLPGREPNWQFDAIREIERELGVRSAFYFLDEQRLLRDRPPSDWIDPDAWRLFADRYSVRDSRIAEEIRRLRAGGWEVGLHGSYESCTDRERLDREKAELEAVLDDPVAGGRQHYLNRRLPETWRHQRAVGLQYDATLGSAETVGFQYGDTVGRPFDDEFVVFPLTMMEHALPDPAVHPERAWETCTDVLEEAAERGAVATVLWHPRTFNERDWPGYASLYRRLLRRALELGAWVGPPGDLYDVVQREAGESGQLVDEPGGDASEDVEFGASSNALEDVGVDDGEDIGEGDGEEIGVDDGEDIGEGGEDIGEDDGEEVDPPEQSAHRTSEGHGARPGTAED